MDAGGSDSFGAACGFTANFNYPTNNAPGGTVATLLMQVPKPTGALSIPAGATYLANFQVSLSSTVTFSAGFGGLSVTLPASLPTSGHTFYAIGCGPVTATCTGTPTTYGPLSVSGQTVGFSGVPAPFTAPPAVYFEAQIYYTTP